MTDGRGASLLKAEMILRLLWSFSGGVLVFVQIGTCESEQLRPVCPPPIALHLLSGGREGGSTAQPNIAFKAK